MKIVIKTNKEDRRKIKEFITCTIGLMIAGGIFFGLSIIGQLFIRMVGIN